MDEGAGGGEKTWRKSNLFLEEGLHSLPILFSNTPEELVMPLLLIEQISLFLADSFLAHVHPNRTLLEGVC